MSVGPVAPVVPYNRIGVKVIAVVQSRGSAIDYDVTLDGLTSIRIHLSTKYPERFPIGKRFLLQLEEV